MSLNKPLVFDIKKYREFLPSWWQDEILYTPAGVNETISILASRLGLLCTFIRDREYPIEFLRSQAKVKAERLHKLPVLSEDELEFVKKFSSLKLELPTLKESWL